MIPARIPKRIDLISDLLKGAVIAEIGVHRGVFAFEMMELPNLGKLYCVDSWRHQPDYDDPVAGEDHEENYRLTLQHLSGHLKGGRVEIIRMDSLAAAMLLHSSEVELDAVFLDASHSYASVLADLCAWSRVLKLGGQLLGHDFCDSHPLAIKHKWGVERAVCDFCKEAGWHITHLTNEEFPSFALKQN